uniref:Putative SWI/SNF-related matrix-associated actin-dependent regulator of chromatin subfamily A member 3-like 2 n=1 Tax=Rhizophora mucronata TaxID=61149 RepID=A0A2P2MY19_RHIMU
MNCKLQDEKSLILLVHNNTELSSHCRMICRYHIQWCSKLKIISPYKRLLPGNHLPNLYPVQIESPVWLGPEFLEANFLCDALTNRED